jgi:tRNA threonylcarbamoyladenosine biosynthesis protein TsaE
MAVESPQVTLSLRDLRDTARIGRRLGEIAVQGDVILLHGDLGAGKTTLTQSIAAGLDVPEDQYVTSPSFALLHEYPGRIPLYHMDCYRLFDEDDVEGAGLSDYIGGPGLTVIEWPDRLGNLEPEDRLDVDFSNTGSTKRTLILRPHGSSWEDRIEQQFNKTVSAQ